MIALRVAVKPKRANYEQGWAAHELGGKNPGNELRCVARDGHDRQSGRAALVLIALIRPRVEHGKLTRGRGLGKCGPPRRAVRLFAFLGS
jgi:hypothetical protein